MRKRYVVSYDISDARRLRKIFKAMKGFGDHIQYSVFLCELSAKERAMLEAALGSIINHRHDQILIIDLGPVDGRADDCIVSLGRAFINTHRQAVVF